MEFLIIMRCIHKYLFNSGFPGYQKKILRICKNLCAKHPNHTAHLVVIKSKHVVTFIFIIMCMILPFFKLPFAPLHDSFQSLLPLIPRVCSFGNFTVDASKILWLFLQARQNLHCWDFLFNTLDTPLIVLYKYQHIHSHTITTVSVITVVLLPCPLSQIEAMENPTLSLSLDPLIDLIGVFNLWRQRYLSSPIPTLDCKVFSVYITLLYLSLHILASSYLLQRYLDICHSQ